MSHPESVTAVLTANEPADGTKLVLQDVNDWIVIVRIDDLADSDDPAKRWFYGDSDADEEPRALHDWLKHADAVYALGEKLAAF